MERNLLKPCGAPVLEKNLLSELSGMMKDSKTDNVNISATSTEPAANNEICFDSGKFAPSDAAKPRVAAAVASTLVRNAATPPKSNRNKMTNVLKEAAKRLSEDEMLAAGSASNYAAEAVCNDHHSLPSPNNQSINTSKKARIDNLDNPANSPCQAGAKEQQQSL